MNGIDEFVPDIEMDIHIGVVKVDIVWDHIEKPQLALVQFAFGAV